MAIAADGGLPQVLRPGGEPLRGPHVVEQFRGRQDINIRFRQAAGELRPFRLGSEADAFPFPLDVLGGPAGDKLAEQVVHYSRTHRLQYSVLGWLRGWDWGWSGGS